MEKLEVGMLNDAATLENTLAVSLSVKRRFTIWPSNSTPWHLYKRSRNICPPKLVWIAVHSSIIHNRKKRKQPKCPSTGQWTHKIQHVHFMEYYLVIKRNKVLICFTGTNLNNVTLNERSQTKRPHIVWLHL